MTLLRYFYPFNTFKFTQKWFKKRWNWRWMIVNRQTRYYVHHKLLMSRYLYGWKSYKLQASRFRGSNNHCTFDNKVVVPSQVLDSRFAFPSLQSLKPWRALTSFKWTYWNLVAKVNIVSGVGDVFLSPLFDDDDVGNEKSAQKPKQRLPGRYNFIEIVCWRSGQPGCSHNPEVVQVPLLV